MSCLGQLTFGLRRLSEHLGLRPLNSGALPPLDTYELAMAGWQTVAVSIVYRGSTSESLAHREW
jgi:hypothetical protein